MTGLIQQGLKRIPVIYKAKDLQNNTGLQPSKQHHGEKNHYHLPFCHCWKREVSTRTLS